MTRTRKFAQALLSFLVILSMTLPLTQTQTAAAQGEEDGVRELTNSGTGKVNFIGPLAGRQYISSRALGIPKGARAPTSAEAAMTLAERFAPEFGIENPARELTEMRINEQENGRVSVHYQQNYQGIPVIGGELVVNTNENGDLYSMNGEVAQELSLDIQPAISAEAAVETAKRGMAKWYGGTKDDYQQTEVPSLWIYDEQLLRPSIRPAELVWRMEMTSVQQGQMVRELVLVGAKKGNIALHFNQIDTAWGDTQSQDPDPTVTPTPLPTEPPVSTEEVVPTETPAPTDEVNPDQSLPTPTGTPISEMITEDDSSGAMPHGGVRTAFNGTTRYVSPTGTDSGTCTNSSSPCAQIQYAINQAGNGDIIRVADGTYLHTSINVNPNVVVLNKGVFLSGGWQNNFTRQTGVSIIDGQNANNGILSQATSATVVDLFIIQNSVTGSNSGAIYHAGTNLTLQNSTLKNNSAGRGAGIYVTNNATLTVINSTISGNTVITSGGGIHVDTGVVNVEYSTIAYNTSTAGTGGGLSQAGGTLNVHNSIIANNNGSASPNCTSLSTSDYNVIGSTVGCAFTAGAHDQVDVSDPGINSTLLGTMQVHSLLNGSSAIDAGDSTSCTANTDGRDQRNISRPQGTGCDIGAYEFIPPDTVYSFSGSNQVTSSLTAFSLPLVAYVVDSLGNPASGVTVKFTAPESGPSGTFANGQITTDALTDSNGFATATVFTANSQTGEYSVNATVTGYASPALFTLNNTYPAIYVAPSPTGSDSNACSSPAAPCATIQGAVNKAIAGNAIRVAGGTYTGATADYQVVNVTKNLTISGGWNSTYTSQNETSIIDGGNSKTGISIGVNVIATLENFTIQNAHGSYGGIYSAGTLTLNDSTIKNNRADGIRTGAAIHLVGPSTVINNTVISNNTGSSGSSIYASTGTTKPVTINNSFIGNNSGTGIVITSTPLNLNNTTVANNSGNGIILSSGASINVQNSTIAYNANTGIYIQSGSGSVTVRNSIIAQNTTGDCSGTLSTADHNIIGNINNCGVTANTGNQLNVNPKLYSTPFGAPSYFALEIGSPAIDAGNPDTCLTTDQRGVSRPQGAACDIGAFERRATTNPASLFGIISGNNQRVIPGTSLPVLLSVYVIDSNGDAVSGLAVTFTAPGSGASGTFAGGGTTATVYTDSSGIATSPLFTANEILGLYTISAEAAGVTSLSFQERNIVWYVSPTGGGACTISDPHCSTVTAALNSATAGDTVLVESGTYSESLSITKNLILRGGWNSSFTAQDGQSVIDGGKLRRNISINRDVVISIDRFDIRNGKVTNDLGGAGILNSGALTFTNGALYNNSAHHISYSAAVNRGGGIYSNGKVLTLINVTVSNNEADTGGGIFVTTGVGPADIGITTLNNVTITQNFATNLGATASGGGIESQNNSPINITNSIIAGNAAEEGQDCYGPLTSGGNNLIGFGVGCTITPAAGDRIGTQFQPIDAKLGDLADNSSYTKTHALLTGSPAIDAGNPATCAVKDQRGVNRPQGIACDMGAFEGSETQMVTANIKTYTAGNQTRWPGDFLCDITKPNCTEGSDPTADRVHKFALGVYNLYLSTHGRKGIDNNNMPIVSTVHYCDNVEGCPYTNSTWSGAQMVYGDGASWTTADDVVGHELTHGVTQYESGLFYFYQSGAIDESFADVWGEYYDQTNGSADDTSAARWLIGEDATGKNALRSMSNPPAYGDPDKMSSSLYVEIYDDYGGVHANSGVNNKAVFLMVDGGTFNGKTVTALGWTKTITIYYEAQTNLLTSGSDYSDLYYALQQACINVTGQNGISPIDCVQVKSALDAVQMNSQPATNFNPDASLCPAGMTTVPSLMLFEDSFENGTGNWTTTNAWSLENYYASSGTNRMFGDEEPVLTDSQLTMANNLTLPAGSTPFLFFKHAFGFEYYGTEYYDGAVLEYSKNNGAWTDAKPLFSGGKSYNGTIYKYTNYPQDGSKLQGKSGFVGDSHGYVSSRYDLRSLAGQNVRFRWRFATDWTDWWWGWNVDDVKIYQCVGTPAIPTLEVPLNNALVTDYTPNLNWADATPALHHYQIQVATDVNFISLLYDENNLSTSVFPIPTDLPADATYYWRVQSFNAIDKTLGWSPTRSFRTALTPPVLSSPTLGEHILTLRPTFNWEDVPNATGYTIQISKTSTFTTPVIGSPVLSTFTPATDLPKGALYWRVQTRGTNGPSAWSEVRSYNGINTPPAPALSAPANDLLVTNYTPTLTWIAAVMPVGSTFQKYQIQIDEDSAFGSAEEADRTTTNYTPSVDLLPNTKYYWRVRTYNTLDEISVWSAVRTFRTALEVPILTSPATGADATSLRPTFEWDDVANATGYTIQIAKNNTFTLMVLTGSSNVSSYTATASLPANITLYWRVRTTGANGPSAWSEIRSFNSANPPSVPVLSLPAANGLTTDYTPALKWITVTVPAGTTFGHYWVQVDDDQLFGSPELDDQTSLTTAASTQIDAPALLPNQKYYWRVAAVNSAGESNGWSAVRIFRTALEVPILTSPATGADATSLRPAFEWDDVANATGYTIQIARNSTFTLMVLTGSSNVSSYTATASLPANVPLYWRVMATGANGPSAPSEVRSFNSANPPSIPVLSLPAANALSADYTPTLKWITVTVPAGTTFGHYWVQVDDDQLFGSPELDDQTSLTTAASTQIDAPALLPNQKYYWRVAAVNSIGEISGWSAARFFRTALEVPILTSPANASDALGLRPVFEWDDVANATGYTIQIAKNNTFTLMVLTGSSNVSSYIPTVNLPANIPLYWRVRATGANGPSAPSEVRSFNSANPPSIPVLSLPAANGLTTDYTPTLKWTTVTVPAGTTFGHYWVQVDDDQLFGSPELDDQTSLTTAASTQIDAPALLPNQKYYWRVAAVNSAGESNGWSVVRTFRTALEVPVLTSPATGADATSLRPAFEWDDVANATGYTIQIAKNNTFTLMVLTGSSNVSSYIPTVNLPANIPLYWRVTATGANGPSAPSEVRSFNSANPPSIPVLSLPAANGLTTDYTPTLKWTTVTVPAGTTFGHYWVQVDDDQLFGSPELDDQTSLTTAASTQIDTPALLPNQKYYWRVAAVNSAGESNGWSAVRIFRTALEVPILTSPATGADATSLRPAFEWDDVANATGYTIQIAKNNTFTLMVLTGSSNVSSYIPTVNLPANIPLYWRVMATGANGPSAPSEVRSFNSANPPSVPVLSLPAANGLTTDYTPTLKWTTVTVPAGTTFGHYWVQLDDDPLFGSPELDDQTSLTTAASTQIDAPALLPNQKYYWRVAAVNSAGESNGWSAVRIFRTALEVPILTSPATGADATSLRPAFEWDDVANATGYTIQIARNNTFTLMVLTGSSNVSSYTATASLPANVPLYWRVMATGANGPSAPSEVRSFNSANPPSIPVLSLPAANGLTTDYTPTLKWITVTVPAGTTFGHYWVQVDDDQFFGSPELDDQTSLTTAASTQIDAPALLPNQKYYWRVAAVNSAGEISGWSAARFFRTALTSPVLTLPAHASAVESLRPAFDWDNVSNATGYTIQISTSSTFATTLVNATVTPSTYTSTVSLPSGYVVFWRVRANGTNGPSAWSEVKLFTTP